MERPLTDQLRDIEEGYAAALFRRSLLEDGVQTQKDFRFWLNAHKPHEAHARCRQMNEEALTFLNGRPIEEAEQVREEKIYMLLRTKAAILWAVEQVESGRCPDHPRLSGFIAWVSQFREPLPNRKPSLPPSVYRGTPAYQSL
jgi:hypothetical protein